MHKLTHYKKSLRLFNCNICAKRAGFTLIEIMITLIVLSVGVVFIYKSFFTSLDVFNYCSNYLAVQPYIDEKIQQAQSEIEQDGQLVSGALSGSFINRHNMEVSWDLNAGLIDTYEDFNLYKINLALSWQEGLRKINLLREAYALYAKPSP